MQSQFKIRSSDATLVTQLQQELGLPRFVAEVLVVRGTSSPEDARHFLNPSLEKEWLDPYIIPGLRAVADALEEQMRKGRHIVVFGDFDLDGISATALLVRALRHLKARVTPFVPLRFGEGYGTTPASIARVLQLKPDFIVTVDCGIASKNEAPLLAAAGVGFAVTDHHDPTDLVPEGVPVANPKLDETCPGTILAGAGVALKLVQIIGARFGEPHLWRNYTDLASLGTVADLMPMKDENRALVADGIRRMNECPRTCIAALRAVAGASDKPLNATSLSYNIIPRLNASGRMGDAQLAIDLLLSDDYEQATAYALELEALNEQRRAIEAELSEQATAQAEQEMRTREGQRVLVVAGEGWHEGVKGIVASRLVHQHGVPALLFTIDGEEARGSGRSVGEVNLFKAVEAQADLLTRFGGHKTAVGVTLPTSNINEFRNRLSAYMADLPAESFRPRCEIDSCVNLGELSLENVEQLERLAPFGQTNKNPLFLACNVMLRNCRPVGADKNHLSCKLSDGRSEVAAIMFRCSDIAEFMACDSVVNAAFELQIDEWRGKRSVKAKLSALAPATSCSALEACMSSEAREFLNRLFAAEESGETSQGAPQGTSGRANHGRGTDGQSEYRRGTDGQSEHEKNRAYWKKLAEDDSQALEAAIIRQLIGERRLHDSQRAILDALEQGKSTLGIMATGRGKSLTFYVHSVKLALSEGACSIFIYPLRALVADQAFHIGEALRDFGVTFRVLTGESSPEERARGFSGIAQGSLDIVLTTPEFLSFHVRKFAEAAASRMRQGIPEASASRMRQRVLEPREALEKQASKPQATQPQTQGIGFVAVDEAHHIGLSKGGKRTAYALLGETLAELGSPTVLALTATANNEVAQSITDTLSIETSVLDETVRVNLNINDLRNTKQRENYLANLIASGQKTVIYVNSRMQTITLARELRKQLPHLASLIGFYNAGLSREERKRVEQLFRSNELCVLVATSAFGEGIDIPNIRNVVLFHLPFNEVEFNQMSGRAGRDGADSTIHLLFGKKDATLNEGILREATPDHDCMAQIYRELRRMQRECGEAFFQVRDYELAERAGRHQRFPVSTSAVTCAAQVFSELGLIERQFSFSDDEQVMSIQVCESAPKVELADSVRYCEGLGEREIFQIFRDWVMNSDSEKLQSRISRPILPQKEGGMI